MKNNNMKKILIVIFLVLSSFTVFAGEWMAIQSTQITANGVLCPANEYLYGINMSTTGMLTGLCNLINLSNYVNYTYLETNYYNKTQVNSLITSNQNQDFNTTTNIMNLGFYNSTFSNQSYVNIDGDTMTGTLNMNTQNITTNDIKISYNGSESIIWV